MLLVAHARSGSTALARVLDAHAALSHWNEPFNVNFTRWSPAHVDHRARFDDAASLDLVLDELFAERPVIKLLGFQLPDDLLAHALLRTDVRVITVRRRNLLQAAVSNLIALQTQVWQAWHLTDDNRLRFSELQPLDVEAVRDRMQAIEAEAERVGAIVDRRATGTVLPVVYEDLHLAPVAQQAAWIAELWRWLGLPPADEASALEPLDRRSAQLRAPSTSGLLPNLAELEAALGDDRTGHLDLVPRTATVGGKMQPC